MGQSLLNSTMKQVYLKDKGRKDCLKTLYLVEIRIFPFSDKQFDLDLKGEQFND